MLAKCPAVRKGLLERIARVNARWCVCVLWTTVRVVRGYLLRQLIPAALHVYAHVPLCAFSSGLPPAVVTEAKLV